MKTISKKTLTLNQEKKTIELILQAGTKQSEIKEIKKSMNFGEWSEFKMEFCEDGSIRFLWTYSADKDFSWWNGNRFVEKNVYQVMNENSEFLQSIIK